MEESMKNKGENEMNARGGAQDWYVPVSRYKVPIGSRENLPMSAELLEHWTPSIDEEDIYEQAVRGQSAMGDHVLPVGKRFVLVCDVPLNERGIPTTMEDTNRGEVARCTLYARVPERDVRAAVESMLMRCMSKPSPDVDNLAKEMLSEPLYDVMKWQTPWLFERFDEGQEGVMDKVYVVADTETDDLVAIKKGADGCLGEIASRDCLDSRSVHENLDLLSSDILENPVYKMTPKAWLERNGYDGKPFYALMGTLSPDTVAVGDWDLLFGGAGKEGNYLMAAKDLYEKDFSPNDVEIDLYKPAVLAENDQFLVESWSDGQVAFYSKRSGAELVDSIRSHGLDETTPYEIRELAENMGMGDYIKAEQEEVRSRGWGR